MDNNPASEGHTLVAPKKHFSKFTDMNAEDVASLFEVARQIAAAVEKASLQKDRTLASTMRKLTVRKFPMYMCISFRGKKEMKAEGLNQ